VPVAYLDELEHPTAVAVTAAVTLAVSWIVAVRRPVPVWELRLTEWINGAPSALASASYPVMQMGTLGGPIVVAIAIVAIKRDWLLGAVVVATGIFTWLAAKGVKRLVQRDRPLSYLPDVVVRDGDGSGLGFISGHSAVAASAIVMAIVVVPKRLRPVAVAMIGIVGAARVLVGVHLVADVVGGWSFGVLTGLGGLAVAGALRIRAPRS
jgi:membrane-associated phospholipid phosphatase